MRRGVQVPRQEDDRKSAVPGPAMEAAAAAFRDGAAELPEHREPDGFAESVPADPDAAEPPVWRPADRPTLDDFRRPRPAVAGTVATEVLLEDEERPDRQASAAEAGVHRVRAHSVELPDR